MGCSYIKKNVVLYVTLTFSWASCVLSGNPTTGWVPQEANSEMELSQKDVNKRVLSVQCPWKGGERSRKGRGKSQLQCRPSDTLG